MKIKDSPLWQDTRPPRRWQAEALPVVLDAVAAGVSGCVQACTGAGKSNVIRELCAQVELEAGEVVVVSTPTERLVEDLAEAIQERVKNLGVRVGQYFGGRKQAARPIVVACNPSLDALACELERAGRRVALWIVDEAHNSESPQVLDVGRGLWADVVRVGFTATPYRADELSLSLFERLLYAYKIGDAMADGVVVPFRVVKWTGDPVTPINKACAEMIRDAIEDVGGPGVVDAASIEDAELFAQELRAEGIAAEVVHSQLGRAEVKRRIRALIAGEVACVVHVAMLKEGVDLPALRWLVMRREVGSRTWIAQHVGRVLRVCDGKDVAVVYDPHDLLGRFSLSYEACLAGGEEEPPAPELPPPGVLPVLDSFERDPRRVKNDPKAVAQVEAWIGALRLALENAGFLTGKGVQTWNTLPPTDAQKHALKSVGAQLARGHLPPNDLPPAFVEELRLVYAAAMRGALTRGLFVALLDVLFAVNRHGLPPIVKLALWPTAPNKVAAAASPKIPAKTKKHAPKNGANKAFSASKASPARPLVPAPVAVPPPRPVPMPIYNPPTHQPANIIPIPKRTA